ncbi:hypothetical protein PT300_09260 [Enterobacteriaceae bacterium ESL0689]|nr:hypothetical protein [Enterobacteriaceae bacterium ESL0689]
MSTGIIIAIVIFMLVFWAFPLARYLYTDIYPYFKDASSQDEALEKGLVAHADIIATSASIPKRAKQSPHRY